jgi:hypothetical protein
VHDRLTGHERPAPPEAGGALSPLEAARQVIAAITPTTNVQVERNARVAGRDVYQIRLSPKDQRSLIDSAVLAVDGQTKVPLRVQLLAKGKDDPAFEVGFTQVQFRAPADEVFQFTPPPGAKVTDKRPDGSGAPGHQGGPPEHGTPAAGGPAVLGESWTSVLVVPDVNAGGASGPGRDAAAVRDLLRAMTPVQGAFGHGRMLRTTLLTVLLTDDGRLYAGAVTPEAIQAAAAQPLSAAKPLEGRGR